MHAGAIKRSTPKVLAETTKTQVQVIMKNDERLEQVVGELDSAKIMLKK
jgi:hypothetical protein